MNNENEPPASNSRIAMVLNKQSSLLGLMYGVLFVSKLRFFVIFMKPASIVENIDQPLLNIDLN